MSLPIVLITGQLLTDAVWQPLLDAWADREVIVADNRSDDTIEGSRSVCSTMRRRNSSVACRWAAMPLSR